MNGFSDKIGIYLHIPFCKRKCPYCDFFSVCAGDDSFEKYTEQLCRSMEHFSKKYSRKADTLYFGGGTPSLIGEKRLGMLCKRAKECFGLENAEITLEVNPEKKDIEFEELLKSGINRLSIGLQSSDDRELRLLGRLHDSKAADRCVREAQRAGFENISLDLMIAIPSQTDETLLRSIEFCASHGVKHVSAYLLKIEQGTDYFKRKDSLLLPDEDRQAEMYLSAIEKLSQYGYRQYEISNFAVPGFEGRHNLKYWHDEEYLGIGPAAHSFVDGRRFYFERSFESFDNGIVTDDGAGGDEEEFFMLGLRLAEGVTNDRYKKRFGSDIPREWIKNAVLLSKGGYTVVDDACIRLTPKGFLMSNAVITQIIS